MTPWQKSLGWLRGYLKFQPPKTKGQKWAAGILAAVVLLIIFALWGFPPAGVYPVWGISMQPTIKWITLPDPWARWSFSGWIHISREIEPKVNSIIVFREHDLNPKQKGKEGKRVAKILLDGSYWVEPDNSGISGMGSGFGFYNGVPRSAVVGVITSIWTPKSFTAKGRLELRVLLSQKTAVWTQNGLYLVSSGGDVYDPRGKFLRHLEGSQFYPDIGSSSSLVYIDRRGVSCQLDLQTGIEKRDEVGFVVKELAHAAQCLTLKVERGKRVWTDKWSIARDGKYLVVEDYEIGKRWRFRSGELFLPIDLEQYLPPQRAS